MTGNARKKVARLVAVPAVVVLALGGLATPAHADVEDYCRTQLEAYRDLKVRVAEHNAKPDTYTNKADVEAYNAEAKQLEAEKTELQALLNECVATLNELTEKSGSDADLKSATDAQLQEVTDAVKTLPANWSENLKPTGAKDYRVAKDAVARKLYDALDANPPGTGVGSVSLRNGARPQVGEPDARFPGLITVPTTEGYDDEPAVTADRIIPLAEVMALPGFDELSPANMWTVAHAPANLEWQSYAGNVADQSRSAALLNSPDPVWSSDREELKGQVRTQLLSLIKSLLATQD